VKGAATITATYIAHGTKFRVLIRPANAKRLTRVVDTEQDAIDLVRHFNRLGLAGVDLGSALAEARTESAKTYAPLREALPTFLAEQVTLGNLRASSARVYRSRLERWAYPELGAIPWNLITREDVGAAILAARRAGKSRAVIEGIRGPLTKFYQWQMHAHRWPGPNPAAELSFFVGKVSKATRQQDLQWFRREEAQRLLEVCRAHYPRWVAFLAVSFACGTRWGETTALEREDIDWARGRLHVWRTWSEPGNRIEACKDGEGRWIKVQSPGALQALRAHVDAVRLEAQVKDWPPDRRRLVFPNSVGRVTRYGTFRNDVWLPLLTLAGLPYRKPHAMRHSYATWLLEGGADLRYVKDQMGHASIEETEGTYGHLEREKHEAGVAWDL